MLVPLTWGFISKLCDIGTKSINWRVKFEVMITESELKSPRDIQVFIGFGKFYWQFIKNFYEIATSLLLMLKTTSIAVHFARNRRDFGRKPDFTKANSSKIDIFIHEAWIAFIELRKAFTKTSILYYFDPEYYI